MSSPATGHPAPEAIVAFVDGEASPEVEMHIQGCTTCAAEADELSSTQVLLRTQLYRFDCPTPQTLGEYELGMLPAAERMRIATHALECSACLEELQSVRSFLAVEPVIPQSFAERARRLIASLVAPPPGLSAIGVRGAAASQLRQYQAEGARVSIGAGPEPGSLIGLIVLDEGASPVGTARLVFEGAERQTDIDEVGNFEFDDVPSGSFVLELHVGDEIIVIQHLSV